MVTVGSQLTVKCHEVDILGQGVCRFEGLVIFVKGMLAEEVAQIEIIQTKKRFLVAKIIKVLSASPQRVSQGFQLGAMDLSHLSIEGQLNWQTQVTKNAFEKEKFNFKLDNIIYDENNVFYRQKAVFHCLYDGVLSLKLYDETSKNLADIDGYNLADQIILNIVKNINAANLSQNLTQIIFRVSHYHSHQPAVLVTLVVESDKTNLEVIVNFLKQDPNIVGIMKNIKKNPRFILNGQSTILSGVNELKYSFADLDIIINDTSFLQVNQSIALKAYQKINHFIQSDTIIDAYSGVGVIGLMAASSAKQVTLIEDSKINVSFMQKNVVKNNLNNITVVNDKTENILHQLTADALIVDPPRSGLYASLLEVINQKRFNKIAYLSCDLMTLIRDLKVLSQTYQIESVTPIRMFPGTSSIETLVLLKIK